MNTAYYYVYKFDDWHINTIRMSGLAFLHINYDIPIDVDKVVDLFATKQDRKLEFLNVCD